MSWRPPTRKRNHSQYTRKIFRGAILAGTTLPFRPEVRRSPRRRTSNRISGCRPPDETKCRLVSTNFSFADAVMDAAGLAQELANRQYVAVFRDAEGLGPVKAHSVRCRVQAVFAFSTGQPPLTTRRASCCLRRCNKWYKSQKVASDLQGNLAVERVRTGPFSKSLLDDGNQSLSTMCLVVQTRRIVKCRSRNIFQLSGLSSPVKIVFVFVCFLFVAMLRSRTAPRRGPQKRNRVVRCTWDNIEAIFFDHVQQTCRRHFFLKSMRLYNVCEKHHKTTLLLHHPKWQALLFVLSCSYAPNWQHRVCKTPTMTHSSRNSMMATNGTGIAQTVPCKKSHGSLVGPAGLAPSCALSREAPQSSRWHRMGNISSLHCSTAGTYFCVTSLNSAHRAKSFAPAASKLSTFICAPVPILLKRLPWQHRDETPCQNVEDRPQRTCSALRRTEDRKHERCLSSASLPKNRELQLIVHELSAWEKEQG